MKYQNGVHILFRKTPVSINIQLTFRGNDTKHLSKDFTFGIIRQSATEISTEFGIMLLVGDLLITPYNFTQIEVPVNITELPTPTPSTSVGESSAITPTPKPDWGIYSK